MIDLLDGLNNAQKQAVLTDSGPVLILAGAGSGKTKTLTHRLAYLIGQGYSQPDEILAVTFTNKAANEMRQRTLKLLGRDEKEKHILPFMGTFHSICVRILRYESGNMELPTQFVIFDAQDSKSAIKQVMRKLSINEKQFAPALIQNLISSAKNELIEPAEYKSLSEGRAQDIASLVYPEYQSLLRSASALDFDDLLLQTVKLIKQNESIRSKWQQRFKYIMVDEYQDTNYAQYQLTKLLTGDDKNICVVGDDWQSIYSWRGANFKNILNFTKDYPEATVIKLEQNYRSTEKILNAAQAVINKNYKRSEKKLWTAQTGGKPISVYQLPNENEESAHLAIQISEALKVDRNPSDFAVLYRTNAQSRVLEEALLRFGLPYKVVGGTRFYDRKEIKDIMAYLRFIYQPNDEISFSRIVNVPTRGIGKRTIEILQGYQRENGLSLSEVLDNVSSIESIPARARVMLQTFYDLAKDLSRLSKVLDLDAWIELVASRTGYMDFLDDKSIQSEERLENVKELFSLAQGYNASGIETFLEEVALLSDIDSYDESSSAITLMTLHAAKGLEFPVVFMVGMEEGVFPHSRSLFDEEQLEEERRLCYVGITRAKEELHILHANSRLLFGSLSRNLPARFIAEMGDEVVQGGSNISPSLVSSSVSESDLVGGDYVAHPLFGEGEVLEVEGNEVKIQFKNDVKYINIQYAKLEKLL